MSVSNYTNNQCKYNRSKLKNVLYLVSASHLKDVQIDNGEAYISGLTELPLRINGFNIQLQEETSLDERYKFQKTLTLSMHGYVNYKLFGERYYAIVESEDGTFFMINVDFPSRITHTFNLSQNTNQTDFTFASLSNFPTLKLNADFEAVSAPCIGYNVYGIDKLQLIEKEKALLDVAGKTVHTTDTFKNVDFLGNSCTFQEVYDGFKVTDTITFAIAFDDYKPSWHYNLLEFLYNKYSAIIVPRGNDNKYYIGFNFGLQPSYTIQTASQNDASDVITVTLTETSVYGCTAANDYSDDQKTETQWRFVKRIGNLICYECVAANQAQYLLKQEVDFLGNPTGDYKVLEGFESYFPSLNIVGTFSEVELFESYDCMGETCTITTDIPSTIQFNAATCYTYSLQTSCDWTVTDVPSNITVSPTSGVGDSAYTVTICNSSTSAATNYFKIKCCDSEQLINCVVQPSEECIRPLSQSINCLGQNVQFAYNGNCPLNVTSIASGITYAVGNNTVVFQIPRNYETSAKTWTMTVTNCNCSSASTTLTIYQDKTYEQWVEESDYICESGNSYVKERRYTGTTNIDFVPTDEVRAGTLITSGDTRCATVRTKWEWDNNYICSNGNKYKLMEEFVSYDDGVTWSKTGTTQIGELVEESSSWCQETITYEWRITTNFQCGD